MLERNPFRDEGGISRSPILKESSKGRFGNVTGHIKIYINFLKNERFFLLTKINEQIIFLQKLNFCLFAFIKSCFSGSDLF